jgi:hypothetical protein
MTAYKDAVDLFDETVMEWETGQGEPLCIDKATRHRIWITMGGPSAYVDVFTGDTGDVVSGVMVSTYSGDPVRMDLSEDEVERVAGLFAIGE